MRTFISIAVVLCLAASFISCKKDAKTDSPQSFSWQVNGGATQHSDTTSFLDLFGVCTIYGKKGATNIFISTNSTSVGSYSHANGNAGFGVTIAGVQYNPTAGHISITSNADRRLAGNFIATLVNGSNTIGVGGDFSNIRY